MSYIVKNCPTKPSDIKTSYGWCQTELMKCQDCKNCITKKIIERCKKSQRRCLSCGLMRLDISKTDVACGQKDCPYFRQYKLAKDILEILQIEEK